MAIPGSSGMERGANCATQRSLTIRETLDQAIETHNRAIAQLITLRDTTPAVILEMPQPNLAALVYPGQFPF